MGDQSAFFRAKECIRQMLPYVVVQEARDEPGPCSWICLICEIRTMIDAEHTQPEMANHSTFCHLQEFSK